MFSALFLLPLHPIKALTHSLQVSRDGVEAFV